MASGNEEHLVKIDDFKIDHVTGRTKVIKSGAKLEKPSFGIPSSDYAIFTDNLKGMYIKEVLHSLKNFSIKFIRVALDTNLVLVFQ